MKKYRSSFLIITTLFTLVGCGGGGGSTATASTTATETSKEFNVSQQIPADYAKSVEIDNTNQILYLGDRSLKIIDRSDNDSLLDVISSSGSDLLDLTLSQDKSYLYVIDYSSFLIYNVSDKNNIFLVDSIASRGSRSLHVTGDDKTAVVLDLDGVKLIDISNKTDIKTAYEFKYMEHYISSIALAKNKAHLYTIEREGDISLNYHFKIYDINTSSNPQLLHSESDFAPVTMAISNDETKLVLSASGINQIANIEDIYNIKSLFEYEIKYSDPVNTSRQYISFSDDDNIIVITTGQLLYTIDIRDLNHIQITTATNDFQDLRRAKIDNNFIYAPDGRNGLWIFNR